MPCSNQSIQATSFASSIALPFSKFTRPMGYILKISTVFPKSINVAPVDRNMGTTWQEWKAIIHRFKMAEICIFGPADENGGPYVMGGAAAINWGLGLAVGYFLVPWLFKGDAEHFRNHFNLPGHLSSACPFPSAHAQGWGDHPGGHLWAWGLNGLSFYLWIGTFGSVIA